MIAPGTAVREGVDAIVQARTGALICIGDHEELSFLYSGGIKLDIDYTPALLFQLAKMDGAIVLSSNGTKIGWANVQLMPDPTIHSLETGTRHRTAERVSKQTGALVIAVSAARSVVSLYLDGAKYILEDIPVVLAKANQALATLDKYRRRLDQVSTRLTALEFEGGDPPRRAHRRPALGAGHAHGGGDRALHRRAGRRGAADRDAARGDDGRRGHRQGRARARLHRRALRRELRERARLARPAAAPGPSRLRPPGRAARPRPQAQHPRPSRLAARPPHARAHPAPAEAGGAGHRPRVRRPGRDPGRHATARSSRSRGSATCGRRTSARAFAACRRSTSWTGICKPENSIRGQRRPSATT